MINLDTDLSILEDVEWRILQEDHNLFLILKAKHESLSLIEWINANKLLVKNLVYQYGGILLRNFKIESLSEFNQFSQIFGEKLIDYENRSTPRKKLGGKIYTATEYPSDRVIPMHNENSYSNKWPNFLMFYCLIPPATGGQTPLTDSRRVLAKIDASIVGKFINEGVIYVRNYINGLDLSVEEVFQTDDKHEIEKYCLNNNIEYIWGNNTVRLTTKQKTQSITQHSITNEMVWFNQAHLFHHKASDNFQLLNILKELKIDCYPRDSLFGSGEDISDEVIEHINEEYRKEIFMFDWQRNDIMIIDNLLLAHGRMAYTGERKIAVSMC